MATVSLIERFSTLNTWRRGGEEAPHKALMILYALGRWYTARKSRLPFRDVDRELTKLLKEFGPRRTAYHSEYPFWRLQRDGIWEVDVPFRLETRKSNTDPKKSELLKYNPEGGFTSSILAELVADPELALVVAQSILDARFPQSQHDAILRRVGIFKRDG